MAATLKQFGLCFLLCFLLISCRQVGSSLAQQPSLLPERPKTPATVLPSPSSSPDAHQETHFLCSSPKEFFAAIKNGDTKGLEKSLSCGFGPDSVNDQGLRASIYALRFDAQTALRAFCAGGWRHRYCDQSYDSALAEPLRAAIEKRDANEVRRLIRAGADPNYLAFRDNESLFDDVPVKLMPLGQAARIRSLDMIRVLLEEGASLRRVETWKVYNVVAWISTTRHPVWSAVNASCIECAVEMLRAGADPSLGEANAVSSTRMLIENKNLIDFKALLAFFSDDDLANLARLDFFNPKAARTQKFEAFYEAFLDAAGAQALSVHLQYLSFLDEHEWLERAFKRRPMIDKRTSAEVLFSKVDQIRRSGFTTSAKQTLHILLSNGLPLNFVNRDILGYDTSPFGYAVQQGTFELASILIAHGADVNLENPLVKAIKPESFNRPVAGGPATVKFLIEAGANIEALYSGTQSLDKLFSRSPEFVEIVQTLIRGGLDIKRFNGPTTNLLIHACRSGGSVELVQLLIAHGSELTITGGESSYIDQPLFVASYLGRLDLIEVLLKAGAKVDAIARSGSNRQLILARLLDDWSDKDALRPDNSLKVVEMLSQAGASMNPSGSMTPVYAVSQAHNGTAENKLLPILDFLLKHGALPGPGLEAVMTRVAYWNEEPAVLIIKRLLDGGADANGIYFGHAPLFYFASRNLEIVELLLQHGGDWKAKTGTENAYEIALKSGNPAMISLFEKYGAHRD